MCALLMLGFGTMFPDEGTSSHKDAARKKPHAQARITLETSILKGNY